MKLQSNHSIIIFNIGDIPHLEDMIYNTGSDTGRQENLAVHLFSRERSHGLLAGEKNRANYCL
jgi:hypothetical protein